MIAAPVELVFDTFTAGEGSLAFYGDDAPGWIVEAVGELREGAIWTITFGPSRSRLYRHRHRVEVLDRPRRLRLATTESRPDGSSFDFTIEYRFEPEEAGTRMTIIQSGLPTPELREEHGRGIPAGFDRLQRVLGRR